MNTIIKVFSIQDITKIYNEILGHQINESSIDSVTFLELGGDSMMAIDAAHRIMKAARSKKGLNLTKNQIITANDLFENTISSIYNHIMNGKDGLMLQQSPKRPRYNKDNHLGTTSTPLPNVTIFHETYPDNQEMTVAWKLPLQMCVDARPITIPIAPTKGLDVIVVGSQGGDIVVADASSGKALCRMNVKGKIEGEMSFLKTSICTNNGKRNRFIIFVCSYDIQPSSLKNGHLQRFGYVHAFEVVSNDIHDGCTTNSNISVTLLALWQYKVGGELKNKPIVFSLQKRQNEQHRIIIGSYDGSVTYLDAVTGIVLDTLDGGSLGGAIHADIVLSMDENPNKTEIMHTKVFVASSTWTGTISCILVKPKTLCILWQVNIGSPIYSTPLLSKKCKNVIIFAIDGSIRSIDEKSGKEIWVNNIANRPIFSGGCNISLMNESFIVFGCHDGFMRCVTLETGDEKWKLDLGSAILGTPQYVCGSNMIVATTSAGTICSIDPLSGIKDKAIALGGEVFSSPCTTHCISEYKNGSKNVEETFVFVGCRDSFMYKVWL